MKTTVEWKSGEVEVFEGLAPSVNMDDHALDLVDDQMGVSTESIPLAEVTRVIFEIEEP